MKFGLKINSQFPVGADAVQGTRDIVEQVRAARGAGFDSVWVSQHFLAKPYQALQTWPLLGRLVAESEGMTIGSSIFLLTLSNPAYAAEQAATMDVMTGGRFVFGVGLGYRKEEFEAFGVDYPTRGSRFEECMDVAIRLWTEEEVTHAGKHFRLTNASLLLKPVQRPYPPIWMAASGDPAVRRAARYGFAWLINPHASLPNVSRQMELYRATLADHGNAPPPDFPIFKELSVADTHEAAVETARPYLEDKYRSYAQWGLDRPMGEGESLSVPFEDLLKDRFIVGTPQECSEEIARYRDALGVNHLLLRLQWPGMPQAEVLRAIELIGEKVIPMWRK